MSVSTYVHVNEKDSIKIDPLKTEYSDKIIIRIGYECAIFFAPEDFPRFVEEINKFAGGGK